MALQNYSLNYNSMVLIHKAIPSNPQNCASIFLRKLEFFY